MYKGRESYIRGATLVRCPPKRSASVRRRIPC